MYCSNKYCSLCHSLDSNKQPMYFVYCSCAIHVLSIYIELSVESLSVLPVTNAHEKKLSDLAKNCRLDLSHHFRTNDTFSDRWVVGPIPMGFWTNGYSDQWVFGPMSRRTNGFSGMTLRQITSNHRKLPPKRRTMQDLG